MSGPIDPTASNNAVSATLQVKSNNKFTDTQNTSYLIQQQWQSGDLTGATGWPANDVSIQQLSVSQLALLLLPSQSDLGTFTLTATVTADSTYDSLTGAIVPAATYFETAVMSGELLRGSTVDQSDQYCIEKQGGGIGTLTGAAALLPTEFHVAPSICAGVATTDPTKQQIYVGFTHSLLSDVVNGDLAANPLIAGSAVVQLTLTFQLKDANGNSLPQDFVSGTVTIPAGPVRPVSGLTWKTVPGSAGIVTTP
jgi:hypothetical protein